jgi:cytochrome oxidase Cu insertion factor (SCO1/SenC/PrrC family)
MDAQKKAHILHDMIRRFAAGGGDIAPSDWLDFVEAQNDGYRTGPEIGEKAPDFSLPDQHGKSWTLPDLMGPQGLLLVFSRSADW